MPSNPAIAGYRSSNNPGKLSLINSFNSQARATFACKSRGYEQIVFLGLHWEQEDLPCKQEVLLLAEFFEKSFHATTKIFAIPTVNSQAALNAHISIFMAQNQAPDRLLIVYYSGHGTVKHGLALWAAYDARNHPLKTPSPRVDWFRTQPILMSPSDHSDVLLIIDACHSSAAAGARGSVPNRKVELLAASTVTDSTPGPGSKSFTVALIRTMQELIKSNGSFSVSTLNRHLQHRDQRLSVASHYSDLSANRLPSIVMCPAASGKNAETEGEGEGGNGNGKEPKAYLNLVLAVQDEADSKCLADIIAWLKNSAPEQIRGCEMVDLLRRDDRGRDEQEPSADAKASKPKKKVRWAMDADELANTAITRWEKLSERRGG